MCASLKTGRPLVRGAAAIACAVMLGAPPAAAGTARLLMFDEEMCEWCEAWEAEIGVSYDKTEEAQLAPIERLDIDATLPEDVELDRPARYTPTFVLLHEGSEVGRIEGYAGEHFFYPMLNALLDRLPGRATTQEEPDAAH